MEHTPSYQLAIVGATGAVGVELLRVLERRQFPVRALKLLASARSTGKTLRFRGQEVPVEPLTENAFAGVDFAFFSAGASRSREFVPAARRAGAIVIDNSSAFRMDPDVPLVVPEINPEALDRHQGLVANPNCSAAILGVALAPLHRAAGLRRVIVSTYQSASGAGASAMRELEDQVRAFAKGAQLEAKVFPHPLAFNLFSHNTPIAANGFNEEENKMVEETRKMFGLPRLPILPTCIRVPVLRAHSESVVAEFERALPVEEARALLEQAPGVKIVDDPKANLFPMPVRASGDLDVHVGRLRQDPSDPRTLAFFISGDQLLKGAAWNAVQIAEYLIARGLVGQTAGSHG
ncbi:MAG: aspartate-semialdehyde dehydrogenase [Candidatus Methylacidiphilales bacterium]